MAMYAAKRGHRGHARYRASPAPSDVAEAAA
jgi:hypothetical protein